MKISLRAGTGPDFPPMGAMMAKGMGFSGLFRIAAN
jgi:hypothetical protein